eukprot:TRINITY_DN774_c0_g1_i1.p1 TRINITY_DN774_c0_g1~~TRINITY_DN774_c0_g1_i1.p1  ORF type:complete len:376 (-),score=82.75 TRINITY_DN774_c0_g1_i1:76-1203(-)
MFANRLSSLLLLGCLFACVSSAFEWSVHDHIIHRHAEQSVTYISQPLPLRHGDVINSDPLQTQLRTPEGRYAVRRFAAEIVDESMNSVPLDEVYLHHWVIYTERYVGPCPYKDDIYPPLGGFYFGVGAETRNTFNEVKKPYGFVFSTEKWYANIHVLRTSLVDDVQSCVECHCFDGSGGGGIRCCPDQSRCQMDITQPSVNDTKVYFLKYTIDYVSIDEQNRTVAGNEVLPVEMHLYDVTDCNYEYNVPKCDKAWPANVECVHHLNRSYVFDKDYEIVGAQPHQHIGAIEYHSMIIDGVTGAKRDFCTGVPRYGTEQHVAGNELGYVVGISQCFFSQRNPIRVKKGDILFLNSVYHNDVAHDGVMGLLLVSAREI